MSRRRSLAALFADLNARYFDGALSTWRVVSVTRAEINYLCPGAKTT